MRGFFFVTNTDPAHVRNLLEARKKGISNAMFMERMLMGAGREAHSHMLIPTQMGMFLNQARKNYMVSLWGEASANIELDFLRVQEEIQCSCALCNVPLPINELLPYQIAIRMVGGLDSATPALCVYDLIISLLCRKCQTCSWHSWLVISEHKYIELCRGIAEFGFKFPIKNVPESMEEHYVSRFDCINKKTYEMMTRFLHPESDHRCYVCGEDVYKPTSCPACGCVSFCEKCVGDWVLSHGVWGLCRALKKNYLFHVDQVYYVDQLGIACRLTRPRY